MNMLSNQTAEIIDGNSSSTPSDEEIYRALIGNRADVMADRAKSHRPFNLFAFLLSGFYFLYRKMYVEAAILLSLELVAGFISLYPNLLIQNAVSIADFAVRVLCAVLFYRLYDAHLNRLLAKAKNTPVAGNMIPKAQVFGGTAIRPAIVAFVILFILTAGFQFAFEDIYRGWKPIVTKSVDTLITSYETEKAHDLAFAKDHGYTTNPSDMEKFNAMEEDDDIVLTDSQSEERDNLFSLIVCDVRLDDLSRIKGELKNVDADNPDAVRKICKEIEDETGDMSMLLLTASVDEETQMPLPWNLSPEYLKLNLSFEFNPFEGNGVTIHYKPVGNFAAPVPEGMTIVEGGVEEGEPNYCKIQPRHPHGEEYVALRLADEKEAKKALKDASKREGAEADTLEMYDGAMEGYVYDEEGVSCALYVCEKEGKYIIGELYDCSIEQIKFREILGDFLDSERQLNWDFD